MSINADLRKINSLIIVIAILILIYHAGLSILHFYGIIVYSPDFMITGRILFFPLLAHIVISLYLYFRDNKIKNYPKREKKGFRPVQESIQQYISGIFIILFASLHILNHEPFISFPDHIISAGLRYFMVDSLLFISLAVHLRVSIPRLLVSFGFLEREGSYAVCKKWITCILIISLIIAFIAELIFYIL